MGLNSMPLTPTLRDLAGAVVRVEGGTGFLVRSGGGRVIVTAKHVIRGAGRQTVRWRDGSAAVEVIAVSGTADVAVLADRDTIPGRPLELLAEGEEVGTGSSIWVAGYPSGWQDINPVVSHGELAGVGSETWIAVASTWGNSGGPVVADVDGALRVIGLVVGPGSRAHQDLDNTVSTLKGAVGQIRQATGGISVQMGGLNLGNFAQYVVGAMAEVANLIHAHFRSGFIKIEPVSSIRSLLA